jgi:murein DD-endopeptidase MepM/ murein hydrolase activator NlpD
VNVGRTIQVMTLAGLTCVSACVGPAENADDPAAKARGGDITLASELRIVSARVAPGATLASLLRANGVAEPDVAQTIGQATVVFDPRKVRAAQPYRVERTADGALTLLEYEIDSDSLLRVEREDNGLVAGVVPIAKSRHVEVVAGAIDRDTPSLVAAIDAAGETIDLSIAAAAIFGGEIDFNTDLQPGDTFELLVEKTYREPSNVFAGYGSVLAAQFVNDGRRVRALRFTRPGGPPAYYDEHGASMRRFFLRSPLKFEPVVTSSFSRSRFHPILREFRPHLGVDYRAPAGAPVVASADGVVVEAGMSGGAGRLVHLRHANGFESEYLHLSSIAVRAGARVRQGDVIGRVGSSGLATGPHLDYRLKHEGVFVNPLSAQRAMPPGDPIPAAQMAAFASLRDRVFAQISSPVVAASATDRPAPVPRQQPD